MNQPERPRNALTVIQIILVCLLVISLTLAALFESNTSSSPTLTLTATTENEQPTATMEFTIPSAGTAAVQSTPTTGATEPERPSPTATPPREPIVHTGTGDSVFYPQKWVGPALVRISYSDAGPLAVWTQNDNGERDDLLVSSVGPYHGNTVIDMLGTQRILRFEVRTAGAWTIEVLPLSAALHLTIPGTIVGAGDDIVVLQGPFAPDLLSVDAQNLSGEFLVTAYGTQRDQVVSATGPYAGTVSIPSDTVVLAVKATGPWMLEITTR